MNDYQDVCRKEGPTEPFELQSEDRIKKDILRPRLRSDVEAA